MATCDCNAGVKIIYSCSGAADVGELADRAVRQLRKEGIAQGSCIAALGADLSGKVLSDDSKINLPVENAGGGCGCGGKC